MSSQRIIYWLLAFFMFWSGDLSAQNQRVEMVFDGEVPTKIEADQMFYDGDNSRIDFSGRVRLTRSDEIITGDRALWHDPSRTAEISGNVEIKTLDFVGTAERAVVNMDLKLAKIYDGRAFFPERHYYVSGTVLERQGGETLYVKKGLVTTCDGPAPSWSITASNILLNKEGLATASGVKVNSKYFPVLYLPYFMIPIKQERQSGFLMPQLINSSRDGMVAATPFFWALSEDYDLTFLPVYRSKRGLAMTLEGRYNLEAGQGIWLATYLKDKKDNGYYYKSAGHPYRNSKELYWLRTQNNWQKNGWDLNLDLDVVSDPMFLYSFRNDLDGFYYAHKLLTQYFGRTVNEELDPMRLSTFFAQKSFEDLYFRGTLTYVDNLFRRDNIDTLQNLPSLYLALVSRPLNFGSISDSEQPPRLDIDLRYDYFSRKHNGQSVGGVDEVGHRFFASPSLFWNKNVLDVAELDLRGGFKFTAYSPQGHLPANGSGSGQVGVEHKGYNSSLGGNFNVELASTFSRVFDGEFGNYTSILHQATPMVSFEFVESPDQSELPFWDRYDRNLNRRTIKYGLRNTILAKSEYKNPKTGAITNSYHELLKFGIYSSYEFASNIRWADDTAARYYTIGYFDRGAGPLEFELEANFNPNLMARLISSVDSRTGRVTNHDFYLRLNDNRGDYLSMIYDYDSPTLGRGLSSTNYEIDQLRGDVHLELSQGWSADVSSRYDLQAHRDLETYFTLRYNTQCYGVGLMYADSDNDRRIAIVFDLLGLGTFGTPSTSLSSGRETGQ